MNIDQAVQIVDKICSEYKGTLQEHTTIQQALTIIKQRVADTAQYSSKNNG